jgi:hypothetical protein
MVHYLVGFRHVAGLQHLKSTANFGTRPQTHSGRLCGSYPIQHTHHKRTHLDACVSIVA